MAISFTKVRGAIETRLNDNWDSATYPIAWENTNFDSENVGIYIEPKLTYLNTMKLEAGVSGKIQLNGMLMCNVVGKKDGAGMAPLELISDTFTGLFNEISLGIDAERYIFFRQASLNGPFMDENRTTLQIVVPFICIQQGG